MTNIIDIDFYYLLEEFLPEKKLRSKYFMKIDRIYLVSSKSRERVLKETCIHKEYLEKHGEISLGLDDLVEKLKTFTDKNVSILCASNKKYSLELFLNVELSSRIGYVIMKNRKKTQEEILWEKSLGIKHDI